MTILCYHPVGSCTEDAVATVHQGAFDRFLPLCNRHLAEAREIASQVPQLQLTVHKLFLPALAPDPSRRLGG